MKWTKEKPTIPGWYWWRIDAVPECVAHVYQIEDGQWLAACPEWEGLYAPHVYPLESVSINAQWVGPLVPPEEPMICDHDWGIDGMHSNEFCKKCFRDKPGER